MANIVLDKRTRTPGGRFPFIIFPDQVFTEVSHDGKYSDVFDLGPDWEFLQITLEHTATSVTDVGDTLDASVEFSTDGTNWFVVGMFTQQAGTDVAKIESLTFKPGLQLNPDGIFTMLGVSATVVDEKTFGRYMRIALAIADNDTNGKHYMRVDALIR